MPLPTIIGRLGASRCSRAGRSRTAPSQRWRQLAAHPGAADWPAKCEPANWHDQPAERVQRELDMLVSLMEYRDGVMSEAIAQATNIISYSKGWSDLPMPRIRRPPISASSR